MGFDLHGKILVMSGRACQQEHVARAQHQGTLPAALRRCLRSAWQGEYENSRVPLRTAQEEHVKFGPDELPRAYGAAGPALAL